MMPRFKLYVCGRVTVISLVEVTKKLQYSHGPGVLNGKGHRRLSIIFESAT